MRPISKKKNKTKAVLDFSNSQETDRVRKKQTIVLQYDNVVTNFCAEVSL
jgi:hypothetical protein